MPEDKFPEDELAALLPFYANGTVSAADRASVEAALKTSPALRSELAEVQALQAMVKQGEALVHPADVASSTRLETLLTRIDAETLAAPSPARPRAAQTDAPGFWGRLFSFRWQPAFAAVAASVLVLQSGLIGYLATRYDSDARFGTLSGSDIAAPKASLFVQFRAGARWVDINALLLREDLLVVSGPADSSLGLMPGQPKTDAELAALIAHLRVSPIVTFAAGAE